MPTLPDMKIPPPKGASEFQDITLSCLRLRWSSPTLTQHGRSGQAQQGVDLYGPDDLGRPTGIQCKNQDTLKDSQIVAEIKEAEKFKPRLSSFYFAISGPRDAKLQQKLRLKSEERLKNGTFGVGIFFWDDLVEDLTLSPSEFSKHFPQISLSANPKSLEQLNPSALLAAYDTAYYGVAIRDFINLIFGELGLLSNENPLQLDQLLRTLEASAAVLMPNDRHQELTRNCRQLFEKAISARTGEGEWQTVDGLAGTIEAMVRGLEYSLKGRTLAALDLGFAMRTWEKVSMSPDASIEPHQVERVVAACAILRISKPAVDEVCSFANKYNQKMDMVSSGLPWAAYGILRRELRRMRFAA